MKFMDKKEEVLDIELTDYGRSLLSEGKYMPVYYAFFDDNILYDGAYLGVTEGQNSVDDRIRNETPQLQTQAKFFENSQKSYKSDTIGGGITDSNSSAARYAINKILGTADISTQSAPATSITLLRGEISGSRQSYVASSGSLKESAPLLIPQIDMNLTYKIKIDKIDSFELGTDLPDNLFPSPSPDAPTHTIFSQIAADGTFLSIDLEYIMIDCEEKNTDFRKENFEMEVYEIDDTGPQERLLPLTFARNSISPIKNGILVDSDEMAQSHRMSTNLTPSNVEYYFNINTDEEIDESTIAKSISMLKSKGFFIDTEIKSNDIFTRLGIIDIYGKSTSDEDIEEC